MNKENLLKMADHIEKVPLKIFHMGMFRGFNDDTDARCNSVGCIIGHCTELDKNPLPRDAKGRIEFLAWSKRFTGIDYFSNDWDFLFSQGWRSTDDTPAGAAKRIRYFVENGLPNNWLYIMYGQDPLPY